MPGVPGQEAARIRFREGALAFEEHGPTGGETVVCVHGLTANRSTWRAVARRVEKDIRVVLVDLLGRGQSDPAPAAPYDLESDASRLAELVESLDIRGPFLAGHSHGAAVALACADRLCARGLLLVNPVTPALSRPRSLRLLAAPGIPALAAPLLRLFRVPLTRYTLVRRVFTGASPVPAGAVARYAAPWGEGVRARSLVSILASWDPAELAVRSVSREVPAIVIAGGRDRRIPEAVARAWAHELAAGLRVLPECGHAAPEEEPAAVGDALRALVSMAREVRKESDRT